MADPLENIDATAASPAPGTDGAISTPLPPTRPKSVGNGPDLKRQRILAVIGAIALLAAVPTLGSGLASGASTSESTAVVEAIERAAVSCSIDPSAIF